MKTFKIGQKVNVSLFPTANKAGKIVKINRVNVVVECLGNGGMYNVKPHMITSVNAAMYVPKTKQVSVKSCELAVVGNTVNVERFPTKNKKGIVQKVCRVNVQILCVENNVVYNVKPSMISKFK